MHPLLLLAQAPQAPPPGPSATTIFYWTLLFIFLTAIVTAVVTKWSRDKCLKFFHRYHITLERNRGQTIWGLLKVFPTGLEIVYDHPYVDSRGRKKTSFMMYQQDLDQQLLSVLRYDDELDANAQEARRRQIHRTFNPGPFRRLLRRVRNLINTLRDAFNAAIGAAVGQYQKMNPGTNVLGTQGGQVTQIGQTLLGKLANAYEPLLEQYVGQPVILDVADPLNPNNAVVEYTGYLADYTLNYIALFNVEHKAEGTTELTLPDVERGDVLPPLPGPPPPGAPPPALPAPMKVEHELEVRVDGTRLKVRNARAEPVVARRLERVGYEPVDLGTILPPGATLDLPARDARNGKLIFELTRTLDVVAPRRLATVRHAGVLVERKGLADEFSLTQLPLVPRILRRGEERTKH